MTFTRRTLLGAAAAMAGVGALAGCGQNAAAPGTAGSSGPTTITWYSYNYGAKGQAGEGTQKLLDAFAAAHPEVKIDPVAVPAGDILTKARADKAAGNAPDVVQLGYSKLDEGKKTLGLVSLRDIAGAEWDAHVSGLNPGLLKAGLYEGAERSMPYTVSIPTIFYNGTMFQQAGLDPKTVKLTTADEVRAAAEAVKSKTGKHGIYYAALDTAKSDYLTQSILNSAGVGTVDEKQEITFTSDEAVAALTHVQELVKSGVMPGVGVNDALAAFTSGTVGMFVATTAYSTNLTAAAKGKWELMSAQFPTFKPGTPSRPTHSGAGLVVLAEDQARRAAAWKFLKFVTGNEGMTLITKELGYLPLRQNIVTDPNYLQEYFKTNTLLLPPIKSLETLEPYRVFAVRDSFQATATFQDDAVEPILLRGAPVKDTLNKVADKIRGMR